MVTDGGDVQGGTAASPAYDASVSDPGPLGDDPFGAMPFLGDLVRMLQGQGPVHWDAARQLAHAVAAEGETVVNVDPSLRFHVQELARLAELHVQQLTGLTISVAGRPVEVVPVNRTTWVARTLDAYRPLFERLAGSLASSPSAPEEDPDAPVPAELALVGELAKLVTPSMLGVAIGSMIGHLARRSFGPYDLPIPRPGEREVLLLPATIDAVAEEWSLDRDELLLWVSLHQLTTQAVLGVPHVSDGLTALLQEHAGGFRPDPRSLADRMSQLDVDDPTSGLADLQRLFGDPEVLLGAVRSPEQESLRPRLDALVAVITGYVDHIVDEAAATATASGARLGEVARRRRVELGGGERLLERLLGLHLTPDQVVRGRGFVTGVVDRAGPSGLARLWDSPTTLPTPAEVDAPGLWLARLEYE
jgi:putative hydrolase